MLAWAGRAGTLWPAEGSVVQCDVTTEAGANIAGSKQSHQTDLLSCCLQINLQLYCQSLRREKRKWPRQIWRTRPRLRMGSHLKHRLIRKTRGKSIVYESLIYPHHNPRTLKYFQMI